MTNGLYFIQVYHHIKMFGLLLDELIRYGLAANDQFLMVLMKLQHATANQDLAYRFGVCVTRISKYSTIG